MIEDVTTKAEKPDKGRFAFERAVFRRFWVLLGGATFTLVGFIWLMQQWSRQSLLVTEVIAALVIFYIAARKAWIEENRERIALEARSAKPRRTPAEQHDYETAVRALEVVKEKGIIALRHIRSQGSMKFGFQDCNKPLPPGMTLQDTLWVFNHCASVGLLTRDEKYGSGERTFSVSPSPTMSKALDEVLY